MGDDEKKDDEKKDEKKEGEDGEEDDDPEADAKKMKALIDKKNAKRIKYWYELRPEDEKLREKLKISLKEQRERELLRRFTLKIWNIRLTNLTGETVDAFIQFFIGGDYRETLGMNKEKFKVKKVIGEMGQVFKTDVVDNLDPKQNKACVLTHMTEADLSYQQLYDQHLDMEIWQYNNWKFNDFYAHKRVKLIDICKGEIMRSFDFTHPTTEKTIFRISMNIILQEVWDFNLKFLDFKFTDVMNSLKKPTNPVLELTLIVNSKPHAKVVTTEKDQDLNPNWAVIKDHMEFRGCIAELEEQYLEVALYDKDMTFYSQELISKEMVPLKGVCDTGSIKSEMNVVDCKEEKKQKEIKRKELKEIYNEKVKKDEMDEDDVEPLIKKELDSGSRTKIKMEGKINVGDKPKFQQSGDFTAIRSSNIYMVVHIKRVNKMNAPIDRENYNVFIEIEWNSIKRTKVITETLSPNFNEILFFQMPFNAEVAKDERKFKEWMKNEFMNKFNVRFDLWAEYLGSYENLGSCNFFMEELSYQQRNELEYFYDEEDKFVNYKSRQFIGKKRLISAFRQQENILEFSLWFMPDIILTNELKELPVQILDKFPFPHFKDLQENYLEPDELEIYKQWTTKIKQNFSMVKNEFNNRRMKRMEELIFALDQYRKKHLVILFLTKVSSPQLMNAVNQEQDDDNAKKKKKKKKKKKDDDDDDKFKFIMQNSVMSMDELFHFVRCIPHVANSVKNVWGSPDFLLSSKKGDNNAHALLLASLFMGCMNEDYQIYKKKCQQENNQISIKDMTPRQQLDMKFDQLDPLSLDNRVFLCIGTTKNTEQVHYWVMSIDRAFKTVTFWEVRNGLKYVLEHRIAKSERDKMRSYLCPTYDNYEERKKQAYINLENTFNEKLKRNLRKCKHFLTEGVKQGIQQLKKFIIQEDNFNDDEQRAAKLKEQQQQIEKEIQKEDEEEIFDDEDEDDKKERKELILGFNNFDQLMENMKNRAMTFRNEEKDENKKMMSKEDLMREREMMRQQEEEKKPDKHLRPMLKFLDDEGNEHSSDTIETPYESIDLIVSNKNIFMNLRSHDPCSIMYHFHDHNTWYPFLQYQTTRKVEKKLNPEEQEKLYDIVDPEEQEKFKYDFVKDTQYWKEAIDPFFKTKSYTAPAKSEEVIMLETNINRQVKKTILQQRAALGLQTKFRQNNDLINIITNSYLQAIENYDCKRITLEEFETKHVKFLKNIEFFMNLDWQFECVPIFINSVNPEAIKSVLTEKSPSFILQKEKKCQFAVTVQIFPFAQRVFSVRVMISVFYFKKREVGEQKKKKDEKLEQVQEEDENNEEDIDDE